MKLEDLPRGDPLLGSAFPRRREFRFVLAELGWIPRFEGMTELRGFFVREISAHRYFQGARGGHEVWDGWKGLE